MSNKIPIFIINLKKDTDRRQRISSQLEQLNLDFCFFEGVDGRALEDSAFETAYNANNSLDRGKRELTQGEVGCALSHFGIYQKMLDESIDRVVILEDDAIIEDGFSEAIKIVDHLANNWEIFLLGYSSSRAVPCNFKVNLPNNPTAFSVGISPKPRGCLHGYIINQRGAKKMLTYKESLYQPVDMYTADYRMINAYILYPRVVYQNKAIKSSIGYDWELGQGPKWKQQRIIKAIRKFNNNRRKARNQKNAFSLSCLFSKAKFWINNGFRNYRS